MKNFFAAFCASSLVGCAGVAPPSQTLGSAEQIAPPQQVSDQAAVKSNSRACVSNPSGVGYKEIDLVDVAKILKSEPFRKSEFQTSAEFSDSFNARLEKIRKLSAPKDLLFSLPISSSYAKYDADAGQMRVGNDLLGGVLMTYPRTGITVSQSTRSTGSYIGTNAYGAIADVSKSEETLVQVQLPGPASRLGWPRDLKPFTVEMTRAEASSSKGHLAVLFVGRLSSPYFSTDTAYEAAKIDVPFETKTKMEIIHLDLDCAALYSRSTGKVFREISY